MTTAPALETVLEHRTSLSGEEIQQSAEAFIREGYVLIRGVLPPERCAAFRAEIDRIFREVPQDHPEQGYSAGLRVKLFHYSWLIAEHMDCSPVIEIVEKILGETCHLVSNNIVRNDKSWAISNWHVDEEVLFPLPEGVEHDDRVVMPCLSLNSQWYLTDVGTEDGPTQVVPYSHRSGRQPPKTEGDALPSYRGHPAVSLLARAGDVALQHAQVWHRGDVVRSEKTRYMLQYSYGKRCFAQRFFPFVNYQVPAHVLELATPRRKRLLGFHPRGPWG